jgi:hypothetical protein
VLRWLLPLVAVLAFFGQAVTAYAAAGTIGDPNCCCPTKRTCKCGHEGKTEPMMKRCNGDAKLVAPAPAVATVAAAPVIEIEVRVTRASIVVFEPIPDDVSREPEKPPF